MDVTLHSGRTLPERETPSAIVPQHPTKPITEPVIEVEDQPQDIVANTIGEAEVTEIQEESTCPLT